ncbi:hypothetical protein QUF49_07370 [Fictibacillus sp. b24]|uniref:hypothetical protein n=1 Tax=Fictibacillus sp. b24 TaxID=3055863 RepID=UPI00259FE393|nr:hypothetical protein [Fictibacillus sp. b24]MDM5315812.1 hypothetical protein [Fictibacillus sp. b24]
MRDSWGISGTGETPKSAKRLGGSPHPPESEHPGTETTTFKSNKNCENSLPFPCNE